MKSLDVVIIDDHEVVRSGITSLLSGPEVTVIGSAASGQEGLELMSKQLPDAVLLDIRMPDNDGLSTLQTLRASHPDLPIVMVSTYDNPTYVARSVALGANDYVLKGDSRSVFLDALTRAASGEEPSSDSLLRKIGESMSRSGKEAPPMDVPLTAREVQVLRHVALGLSNKEIGCSLNISVETVKEHVQNILRKLNAADRTDAAVRAVKMGLA
ncbi:Response regulator protein VraR [Rosistilla oblonga]|uniref:Response regulator protein VraR n=1 Tax=Rosistilla oblonga TaxID=2527990 RepID=A0A518IQE6_9BACT|nr:response regulator transcription factor [Rosistilla oblonga]QDV10893.1 Response regulator protein VraR [Rosistilla oblonga]QDV55307.1 Response regulator protein VraR [Rosistilla oblonga]|eukprot:TRINITY_DN58579_c0_g1_i1.p1 TRINITY_DN58579_c0_g1~~TRINITY_DN58579_c0_g1_i1.p1  ORF type:complete len:213 (-),score=28.30 TRINITY_DN58579_c0_g1_i1:170-808(-)